MTKGKVWYVVLEGKADGPHTQEEIVEALEKGRLSYSDLAFRPGFSRWVALGECKEFERRADDVANPNSQPKKFSPPSPDLVGESEKAWVILVKQKGEDGDSHYVQSGPFSMEQIRKKIDKGEIRYEDHVWRKDFTNWKVLKTVEEFERRFAISTPAPEFEPKLENLSEAKTKIDIKIPIKEKIEKAEKQVTSSTQVSSAKPSEVAIKKNEDSDDDMDFIKKKKPTRRMLMAGSAAALGMALTYAGIKAYNENLEKAVFSEKAREVASLKAPPAPVAAPVAAVAAPVIKADAKPQAVNPELENPLPHKPSVLKIVSLKAALDHPQVVLETDLPGGAQIQVEVSARAGSILKYPSFDLIKKVSVHPGQLPTVDFTSDRLPVGDYKLTVRSGELETTTPFAVGERGADFQKKLKAFKIQIAEQRKKEQSGLTGGLDFVSKSYSTMTRSYRKARLSSSQELKKKWANQIKAWRKDFDKQASALKHVDEKNRDFFVYPNELIKLRALEDKLLDVAQLYDKSLKTGRSIASENDMDQTFQEALDDMKISLRKLKNKGRLD